ncbi:hypothetical protein [Aestuariimicrobium ganziense]|uniref:hypothetical protein n=1 Tax=Aestuariimicrobium ganziense TaxID=2773677 RepID=UPI00194200AF|nr:hypothetical protein [Aestuariimicrobium ganziense]
MNDNLHLPPERDVPDPDAMFAAIMAGGSSTKDETVVRDFDERDELAVRRARRSWLAPLAVAAALGLVAVGAGINLLLNRDAGGPAGTVTPSTSQVEPTSPTSGPSLPVTTHSSTPSTTPSATSAPNSPSTSASSTAPSTAASSASSSSPANQPSVIEMGAYGKATLKYLTIERLPLPADFQAPVEFEFLQAWNMRLCVTGLPDSAKASGKLPIGVGAFRSELSPDRQNLNVVAEGGHQPAYPKSNTVSLAVGECVTGYVSVDFSGYVDTPYDTMLLTYQNSLGDPPVVWRYSE